MIEVVFFDSSAAQAVTMMVVLNVATGAYVGTW